MVLRIVDPGTRRAERELALRTGAQDASDSLAEFEIVERAEVAAPATPRLRGIAGFR
ncbi:MAG: hypothetical protein ACYDCK_08805 [Thermoplasmatota archaeon]